MQLFLPGLLFLLMVSCSQEVKLLTLDLQVEELVCTDGQHALEGQLLNLSGIKSVSVNLSARHVQVSYYAGQQQADDIRACLLNFGFTVDGEAGDPAARRRLPSCCLQASATEENQS